MVPEQKVNKLIAEHGLRFLLREDYRTHMSDWTRPGVRAIMAYRLAVWARGISNRYLRWLMLKITRRLLLFVRNYYGIELYADAEIGRRLHIAHQNGIVIHQFATIGDDCKVRQGATLGLGGVNRNSVPGYFQEHAPVIGNRVDIGTGAKIVGNVRVGNDVKIGPNAVVLTDIPDDSTVLAPMSKVLRRPPGPTPED